MSDKIRFKLVAPASINEDDYHNKNVVEIYINNREIVSILKPIEERIKDYDDGVDPGGYGHRIAKELYHELSKALIPGTCENKYGAEILCCRSCGEPGCWSPMVKVTEEKEFVKWTLVHNHRKWDYKLTYRFKKEAYEAALYSLKTMQ